VEQAVSDEAVSNQDLDAAVYVAARAATITSREDNCSSNQRRSATSPSSRAGARL
jgi:hypothetical protein